ncbi:energy transducer TonB [Ideonella sp.]|uniref:energy transducer TonB n=1 Tax=Ideonella sp. TaxID=1929293 RepID=UPI0035B1E844
MSLSSAFSPNRGLPPALLGRPSVPVPAWARRGLVAGVVAAHVGGAWGLMQIASVREAVAEVAPLVVDFIAAPPPPLPPKSPPPPSPPVVPRTLPPPPAPVIATTPAVEPAQAAMVVPPSPADPPAPAEPSAPPAPPAPPAPAVARTIPATAVSYLEPPAPVYPLASRRLHEQGEVLLKVEIGTDGRASQVLVSRSSGSPRLDNAALAAVRAARFKPYTENGVPLVVWTTVPIQFELENKP